MEGLDELIELVETQKNNDLDDYDCTLDWSECCFELDQNPQTHGPLVEENNVSERNLVDRIAEVSKGDQLGCDKLGVCQQK